MIIEKQLFAILSDSTKVSLGELLSYIFSHTNVSHWLPAGRSQLSILDSQSNKYKKNCYLILVFVSLPITRSLCSDLISSNSTILVFLTEDEEVVLYRYGALMTKIRTSYVRGRQDLIKSKKMIIRGKLCYYFHW